MRSILIIVLFLFGSNSFSQTGKLVLKGRVENDTTSLMLDSVTVTLTDLTENKVLESYLTGSGGYYILPEVSMKSNYKITFSRKGFVEKSAVIDLSGVRVDDNGNFPIQVNVSLFKGDIANFLFLKYAPIAIAKYNVTIDNMEWDTSYIEHMTKLIKNAKKI